ncbi:MAG: PP2C family protein-serine/threonine phosphatase [Fervidobacterium pennivorans]
MPKLTAYYYTNIGKVRQNNEDALVVDNIIKSEESFENVESVVLNGKKILLAVADGMGGHSKGEVAARLVLDTLNELKDTIVDKDSLKNAINKSKDRLEEYVKEHPEAAGLGCALAGMLVLNDEEALIFNVGDCRVYRYVNNTLRKLTRDHSLVEALLSDGLITPEEARTHPQKNVLTSAIMGDGYQHTMEIYVNNVYISIGGTFLICSDGLWGELSDEEIVQALSNDNSSQELLEKLSNKKLSDNVTFIVFHVNSDSF